MTAYKTIFTDAWNFMKQFQDGTGDANYWNDVCNAASDLDEKHAGQPEQIFSRKIIMAIVLELERLRKGGDHNEVQ